VFIYLLIYYLFIFNSRLAQGAWHHEYDKRHRTTQIKTYTQYLIIL